MIRLFVTSFCFIFFIIIFSCNETTPKAKGPYDKRGIGPIKELELAQISDSLMKVGMQSFKENCSQCHTMEYKNTGPDISDILAIRKPQWVLNFLLNKDEMLKQDSFALITRKKYEEDCGATVATKQEALELLEYLRIYQIWLHEFNAINN